jgi:endonuclease/exonuclease/phosphatase (EEP) superfamily protein YafD
MWVTLARGLRLTRPVELTVLPQSLTPFVYAPATVVAALAVWRRRWFLSVIALALVAVYIVLLVPALTSQSVPTWAVDAPRLTVLSANVYDANSNPAGLAERLVGSNADVLVLVEVNRSEQAALERAGIDGRFRYHWRNEFGERTRSIEEIYSRYPIRDETLVDFANQTFPQVVIEIGSTPVTVLALHVADPTLDVDEWRDELASIDGYLTDTSGPLVVAGDFNATRWNPQYAALLDGGVRDAVESRGRGLSFSWPVGRHLPRPVMRLDHALGNAFVAAIDNHDVDLPGSDHLGLITTWAIRDTA